MSIQSVAKDKYNEEVELQNLVIYCLIRGNIKNIKANIDFIRLYRHKSLLSTEDEYFLNLLEISILYIQNVIIDDSNNDNSCGLHNSNSSMLDTIKLSQENIRNSSLDIVKLENVDHFLGKDIQNFTIEEIELLFEGFNKLVNFLENYKNQKK